ncbi:MAG: SusD/RagB family nutrient-binding outer membrane lipoprotein [Bacteroidota bacterium]
MKNYKIKVIGTLILLMVVISSCKKWMDPEYNKDPGRPSDVSLALLTPGTQVGLGYAVGGDLKYAASMWMQQLAGGANQPLAYDRYTFTQSDVDNVWKYAMYSGPMVDMKKMMDKAKSEGSPWYAGIAKVEMAYSIGCITDLWNDAPYSEAFQGDANLTPKYDTQSAIYDAIFALLNDAIADFNQPATANISFPGGDDFIYGGDITLWTKAAYSLEARYYLHKSKRDVSAYANALTALANGFTSNAEDMQAPFGNSTNENNPMYQFMFVDRPGDIVIGAKLIDGMITTGDPRFDKLVDTAGGGTGSHPGAADGFAYPGPFWASANSPVPFMSYVELKFIEAEAKLGTSDAPGAATAFNDAVKASLAKMGVTNLTWEALYANETGSTITLEKIIGQKYFALCYQLEVYNDWRRTGFPVLVPATNSTMSTIPRRYPYPTSERLYNGANMPIATIADRVWWDLP